MLPVKAQARYGQEKVTLPKLGKFRAGNVGKELKDSTLRKDQQIEPQTSKAVGAPSNIFTAQHHLPVEARRSCRVRRPVQQIGLKDKLRLIQSMDLTDFKSKEREIKALRDEGIAKNQHESWRNQVSGLYHTRSLYSYRRTGLSTLQDQSGGRSGEAFFSGKGTAGLLKSLSPNIE